MDSCKYFVENIGKLKEIVGEICENFVKNSENLSMKFSGCFWNNVQIYESFVESHIFSWKFVKTLWKLTTFGHFEHLLEN